MAITITDNNGQQYRLSGEEENLLAPLLHQNAEARIRLIAAIVEFDNRRLRLLADALAGRPTPGYGDAYTLRESKTPGAIREIRREYDQSIEQLREVLGEGADDMISAYRRSHAAGTGNGQSLMFTRRR